MAASDQLRAQIHATIGRYAEESDITTYQVVGVLEAVKFDLMEALEKRGRK